MPIVFDGNNYSGEWLAEAERRGLPNFKDTVSALEHYSDADVMSVFSRQGILSDREMSSRQEILFDHYAHTIGIEANLALRIGRTSILPAALDYQEHLAKAAERAAALVGEAGVEIGYFRRVREHVTSLIRALDVLESLCSEASSSGRAAEKARFARDRLLPAMRTCREHADALEGLCRDRDWPLPLYAELLWMY